MIIDEGIRHNKDVNVEMKELKCPQCGGNRFEETAVGINKCLYCGTVLYSK